MSVAQCRAARTRGKNYRKENGPWPVSASKARSRLERSVNKQKAIAARRGAKAK